MATTTPRPATEALDVPVEQVEAEATRLRREAGALAEQRHQVYDLDADSKYTLPGCCPTCPPKEAS